MILYNLFLEVVNYITCTVNLNKYSDRLNYVARGLLMYSIILYDVLQFSFLKLVDQHLILIMALLWSMELIEMLTLVSVPFNHFTLFIYSKKAMTLSYGVE